MTLKLKQGESAGQGTGDDGQQARIAELEPAARAIITALHAAKQELAKEMEANLKQLKAVLEETQRIAKDMEAVLREAKAEPNPEQLARGQRKSEWNPPGYHAETGSKQESWDPLAAAQKADDKHPGADKLGKQPEAWEPPPEAEATKQAEQTQ